MRGSTWTPNRFRLVLVAVGLFGSLGLSTGTDLLPAAGLAQYSAPPDSLAPPSTAPPDTALVLLRGAEAWPAPHAVHLTPDSLLFGQVALLALDFAEPLADFAVDSLVWSGDWIEAVADPPQAGGLAGWWARLSASDKGTGAPVRQLPSAAGWRALVPLRVYRVGPFQVHWSGEGGPVSTVVQVAGRATRSDQTAVIRDPQALGWNLGRLLAVLLVLGLLVAGAWWLWRRRRRIGAGPADRPLSPPAYLSTAVALWELEQQNLPAGGEGRQYLDRLARLLRGYLVDRFRIRATELTADEIVPAAVRHGYASARLAPFAAVLARADSRRFSPTPTTAEQCRRLLVRSVALIDAVRITPPLVPVDPALLVAGDQAWSRLSQRYGGVEESADQDFAPPPTSAVPPDSDEPGGAG